MNAITLKQFAHEEAARCHLSAAGIYTRIYGGLYPGIRLERKSARVVIVLNRPEFKGKKVPATLPAKAATGEITMKEWRMQEAQRLGIVESAVAMRLMRGFYPDLNIRRINGRARFVTPAANLPITFTPEKEAASASVKIGPPNDTGPNNRESRKSIGAAMPMDAISRRPSGPEHDTAILSRAMKAVQGRRRGVRQIP